MKRIILFLSVFMSPALVVAGGWTATGSKIKSMKYESNILVIEVTEGTFKLYDNCETEGYLILEDETVRGDRQLSMLLAAQMAGKNVSIYTAGCTTKWDLKYPKVWSVKIDS